MKYPKILNRSKLLILFIVFIFTYEKAARSFHRCYDWINFIDAYQLFLFDEF